MMLVRTYIAPSTVEGVGVFAAEPIKTGQLIWRLEPEFDRMLSKNWLLSAPSHFSEFIARYAYPAPNDPETLVLEIDNGRFMNHSNSPNTDFTKITEGYAKAAIREGEELVCNYNEFDPMHELLPSFLTGGSHRADHPGPRH